MVRKLLKISLLLACPFGEELLAPVIQLGVWKSCLVGDKEEPCVTWELQLRLDRELQPELVLELALFCFLRLWRLFPRPGKFRWS